MAILLPCGESLPENEAKAEEWGAERGGEIERVREGGHKHTPQWHSQGPQGWPHPSDLPIMEADAPPLWPSLSLWGFNYFSQALCSAHVYHEFQVLQLP